MINELEKAIKYLGLLLRSRAYFSFYLNVSNNNELIEILVYVIIVHDIFDASFSRGIG